MKRRPFTLACAATLLTPTAFAQGPLKLTAGKDYVKLDRPIATETEA
ncbi:MAG: thiol:disulfide interchange protein DsbA/DsbL, partial [Betaproteobacteria bacterium]|nr:thiol:disulfide interchange protein DsbA/DsbL [Betaproteobacteria bacterium]